MAFAVRKQMTNYLIKLKEIPSKGINVDIDDQSIWQNPIIEFKLPYKIYVPCHSKLNIQVDNECCILKGNLKGGLIIPCDRCAEDAFVSIDNFFKIVEQPKREDSLDISFVIYRDGELYLDLAGLLWEQLILNIPAKVLCSEECKGLCPFCGTNLNKSQCRCKNNIGDPRLEILRKIKIY